MDVHPPKNMVCIGIDPNRKMMNLSSCDDIPLARSCWLMFIWWNILLGGDWNILEPWNFMTVHSVGNVRSPTDELIFFRGVETTNPIYRFPRYILYIDIRWSISTYQYLSISIISIYQYLSLSIMICQYLSLSIYLYLYLWYLFLPTWLSIYLSVCLSGWLAVCRSIYLSVQLSIYLSIYPSIHPSIRLSASLSMYLTMYLSICLSIYLSICLSVCLSICLSVYLSICQSVYLFIYLSICVSIYLSICLSIYLSICLSIYLSIYLYVCFIYICTYAPHNGLHRCMCINWCKYTSGRALYVYIYRYNMI